MLQISIEFLRLSITVVQFLFTALTSLIYTKCNRLKARVVIYAYNHHVRLLSPSLRSSINHSLLGSRGRHCYAIMWSTRKEAVKKPKYGVRLSIKREFIESVTWGACFVSRR